jgi:hypothetical protein
MNPAAELDPLEKDSVKAPMIKGGAPGFWKGGRAAAGVLGRKGQDEALSATPEHFRL